MQAINYYNYPRIPSVSPYLFILRVSPKAIAQAFKSFHSLLSLNTEYGGQRRVVYTDVIVIRVL